MLVKLWMSKDVLTASPEMPIMEAERVMREHNIRRLPVVKKDKLVGIVTLSDIREAGPSDATSLSIWEVNYLLAKTTVEEVMTREVFTISPESTIEEAALLMRERKVGSLPVVEDSKLVGIITESDVFEAFLEVLGIRWGGVRISLELEDRPGALVEALEPIKGHKINVISVCTCRASRSGPSKEVVIRMEARDVEPIVRELEARGIKVLEVRRQEAT